MESITANRGQRCRQYNLFQICTAIECICRNRGNAFWDLDFCQAAASTENMTPVTGVVAVTVTNRCVGPVLRVVDLIQFRTVLKCPVTNGRNAVG